MLSMQLTVSALSLTTTSDTVDAVREHNFVITPDGELIEIFNNLMSRASEEWIVLGSYILSRSQTKELADNMRRITNPGWDAGDFLLGLIGGIPGASIALCASLARNAVFRNDVIYAADHNLRVKVTITDSKYGHTSYSTQVTCSVVA